MGDIVIFLFFLLGKVLEVEVSDLEVEVSDLEVEVSDLADESFRI